MRLLFAVFLLCCLACGSFFAAPAPRPKPGPRVIDFTKLVGCSDFNFILSFAFEDSIVIRKPCVYYGTATAECLYVTLTNALPDADIERDGEARIILKGWKGKKVLDAEFKAEGIPRDKQPKIYRLKEKK